MGSALLTENCVLKKKLLLDLALKNFNITLENQENSEDKSLHHLTHIEKLENGIEHFLFK